MSARHDARPCAATTAAGAPCRCYAIEGSDRCVAHVGRVRRRPTLTPEITDRVCQIVSSGNYLAVAIAAAGVPRRTFYDWWKRGDPAGQDPKDAGLRDMRDRVELARAEGEARNVALIARAAAENWQAAAWILERSVPERWARPSQRDGRDAEPPAAPAAPPEAADPFAEADDLAEARRRRGA